MSLRLLTALRHFVTALTLLIVVLFGVEIWLRSTQAPTALIVAGQAAAGLEALEQLSDLGATVDVDGRGGAAFGFAGQNVPAGR